MTTTENIKIDSDGFICENAAQEDGKCSDYEMRACCQGSLRAFENAKLAKFCFILFFKFRRVHCPCFLI